MSPEEETNRVFEMTSAVDASQHDRKHSEDYEAVDKAISPWSLSNKQKAVLSGLGALVAGISAVAYRVNHSRHYLQKPFEVSVDVQTTWGYAIGISTLVFLSLLFLIGFAWWYRAVQSQRQLGIGRSKPIQSRTADLIQDTDSRDQHLEIFARETVEEFLKHELVFDERRRQKAEQMEHLSKLYRAAARLIAGLDEETFRDIFARTKWMHLTPGEVVYERGDDNETGMYFVIEGAIGVFQDGVMLAECLLGDSFGEPELFDSSQKRKITFKATKPTELVQISKEAFDDICKDRPDIMISYIRNTISRQWRNANYVLETFFNLDSDYDRPSTMDAFLDFVKEDQFGSLVHKFEKIQLNAGDLLYSEGSSHKSRFYIIVSGSVGIYSRASEQASAAQPDGKYFVPAGSGAVLGAVSFVVGCARLQTVRAIESCEVLHFGIDDFDNNIDNTLSLRIALAAAKQLSPEISRFTELGFEKVWLTSGKCLFESEKPAEAVYIVVSGRLRVVDQQQQYLVEIARGECLGEMAMLAGEDVHKNTAFALRDTELVKISRAAFEKLQHIYPQMIRKFAQVMAQRIRSSALPGSTSQQSPAVSTVAIYPTDRSIDTEGFARGLVAALSDFGSTVLIDKAVVDEIITQEGGSVEQSRNQADDDDDFLYRNRITTLLADQEQSHDFAVYVAESDVSSWTRCCIRQADCVLILAQATQSPEVSSLENRLIWESQAKTFSRKELVLLHSSNTSIPSGTRYWFDNRRLHSFHHVRVDTMVFFYRLARYLAGKAFGLVLGGGGARGLAHLGVIKALREQNVPIDFLSGTSQGAFMGALYAYHMLNLDAMEKQTRAFAEKMGNIWELVQDATFPVMSYFSGKKFNEHLRLFFGDSRLEDLWIPCLVVTTNFSKADVQIHRTGSVWKTVRASMSIISYLPPMYMKGDILIDGGYINNLPVDILKETFSPSIIIASDIENKSNVTYKDAYNYGMYLNGWYLLGLKLLRLLVPCYKGPRIPRFAQIVDSLIYMNHNRTVRKLVSDKQMNIYINPELGNTMLLDYHKFSEIVSLGYKYCRVALAEWKLKTPHKTSYRNIKHTRSQTRLSGLDRNVAGIRLHGGDVLGKSRAKRRFSELVQRKMASDE